MSRIPGERTPETRRPFHDKNGGHPHADPATYARRSEMSGWERAYARHLERHRELAVNPEPMEGDPQVVTDLFAHIEILRAIIEKEKLLITAIRQKAEQPGEGDDKDQETIRRVLRDGGVTT